MAVLISFNRPSLISAFQRLATPPERETVQHQALIGRLQVQLFKPAPFASKRRRLTMAVSESSEPL